jgi:D-erythro-7,8-dihydroneopterin triphosphate epimerase
MAVITIKNLLLRAEAGFNPHEIGKMQDLRLNISIEYDLSGEELSDNPEEALDYRTLSKEIIELVEGRQFNLIEKVAGDVARHLLVKERVNSVTVEVDKPHALRFAKSVSFTISLIK